MRKIISQQENNKKKRRNQIIIGIILVGIMLLSTVGYSFGNFGETSSKADYNGIIFIKENGFWNTELNGLKLSFIFFPSESFKIESELNDLSSYYDKPLYIYSEEAGTESEVYRNLFYQNQIIERMQYACPEGKMCNADYPVKNCSDNFIIIKKGEASKIYQQDNCVFIEGKTEDLASLTDSFLFKLFEIQ